MSVRIIETLVESALVIEKARVQTEVRQTHLFLAGLKKLIEAGKITKDAADILTKKWKQNRDNVELPELLTDFRDEETDELRNRILDLEKWVDGRVEYYIKSHPAFPWFNKIKGVGRENIGKVVGFINIERAPTISALWKFAGYSVDKETNTAPVRVIGEKLTYCSRLRSMCWRLGDSLIKADGVYHERYKEYKKQYEQRCEQRGIKIVPALSLPKDKDGKHRETETIISKGHVHNMALRKMMKLFLACLWLYWRKAVGLPVTDPWIIGREGHSRVIMPEDMTDI